MLNTRQTASSEAQEARRNPKGMTQDSTTLSSHHCQECERVRRDSEQHMYLPQRREAAAAQGRVIASAFGSLGASRTAAQVVEIVERCCRLPTATASC